MCAKGTNGPNDAFLAVLDEIWKSEVPLRKKTKSITVQELLGLEETEIFALNAIIPLQHGTWYNRKEKLCTLRYNSNHHKDKAIQELRATKASAISPVALRRSAKRDAYDMVLKVYDCKSRYSEMKQYLSKI